MPAVSVIVPVFNAKLFFTQCLDSICNQTFTDFEVICVDDGSTDGCQDIYKEYMLRDSRFHLLTQANSGVGAARNAGIALATGKYLAFLDSDDFWDENFLKCLLECAEAENADISYCTFDIFDHTNGRYYSHQHIPVPLTQTFQPNEYMEKLHEMLGSNVWNKLFLRSFVQGKLDLKFPILRRGEDLYYCMLASMNASRIAFCNKVLIHYRCGLTTNLESNSYAYPMDFCESLFLLNDSLHKIPEFSQSLYIIALRSVIYQLEAQKNKQSFKRLRDYVADVVFPRLKMEKLSPVTLKSRYLMRHYRLIMRRAPRLCMQILGATEYLRTRGLATTLRTISHKLRWQ